MVGIAVIGAGHWGKNLVRNFASLKSAELKYVCDLSESIRQQMAALYPQATVTDDMAKALSGR